ncbi:hypothetical protein [Salinispora mooreana]|uniref:hypothetical protein n=1 Tax=Salinispora mooreana TaxID=999545 RepID=UPI000362BDC3|nr:hypothetical protein [Salinispora mooreana]
MTTIRNAWRWLTGHTAPTPTIFRRPRSRPARLDAVGPATRYAARAGAYRPLWDQPTVIFDSRPLLTPLAWQRANQR